MIVRRRPAAATDGTTLEELAPRAQWVAWRTELPDGREKPTKVPYDPSRLNGRNIEARSDDPTTWGTRAQAEKQAEKLPRPFGEGGVGIMLGACSDTWLAGIDLDTCRDPQSGVIEPWAQAVLDRFDTYAEVSPSGTGVKAFFQIDPGDIAPLRAIMGTAEHGKQFKRLNGSDHPPAIELYISRRYFAVTWERLPDSPVELRRIALGDLRWLIMEAGPAFAPAVQSNGGAGGHDDSRSGIAFRKGVALRREGKTFEEMCDALRDDPETTNWFREKGDPNRQRELHRIWDKVDASTPVDALLEAFNDRYMVVNEAGEAVIYQPRNDPLLNRRYFERMNFANFRRLYLNRTVEVGRGKDDKPIREPIAEVWLRHPERRQYIEGVRFDPSGTQQPGVLNLWQGFAVEPREGSWERMLDHIQTVICRSDGAATDYLLAWMASVVQRPDRQGEVAVVMRGGEGTGKGTLARALKHVLGQHGLAISNAKHLVGNFNAHLRDCVLLFADEAFFAGDKAHIGVLKSLVTEPYLTIEGKYQNAVQTPNFLHIMIASNEDWVVPAALDARRWFVLEISDERKDDHAYFEAISREMEAGGYEAMLHDLLKLDISDWHPQPVPKTVGLQQQQQLSLKTEQAWWLDVLHRGYVFESRLGLIYFRQWFDTISTELLYASYKQFVTQRRDRHLLDREAFGRFMISTGAVSKRIGQAAVGERLNPEERCAETVRQPRAYGYRLGSLKSARADFTNRTKLEIDWRDAAPDDAEADEPVSSSSTSRRGITYLRRPRDDDD